MPILPRLPGGGAVSQALARDVKNDPFATDPSPRASVNIAGQDFGDIKEYSYDSDILQIGDPVSFKLANVGGILNGKIHIGDPLTFYLADPDVLGGTKTRKLKGIVTKTQKTCNKRGSEMIVTGADLGWHLVNNSGPLWKNLRGITFEKLLATILDPSWGLSGVRADNGLNRAIKQGKKTPDLQIEAGGTVMSIQAFIVIEPGDVVADLIIRYAKRNRLLVNVSNDGFLQMWQPNYKQPISYTFHLHNEDDPDRKLNNVEDSDLTEMIDGVYTDVVCVGTKALKDTNDDAGTSLSPSFGHFKGKYHQESLPFSRLSVFADSEPWTTEQANTRARWRAERGLFDSWVLSYTVPGLSQNGLFYEADAMCEVNDSVNSVFGRYYVSAVQYTRTPGAEGGTKTRLSLRKPDLLAGGQ